MNKDEFNEILYSLCGRMFTDEEADILIKEIDRRRIILNEFREFISDICKLEKFELIEMLKAMYLDKALDDIKK